MNQVKVTIHFKFMDLVVYLPYDHVKGSRDTAIVMALQRAHLSHFDIFGNGLSSFTVEGV